MKDADFDKIIKDLFEEIIGGAKAIGIIENTKIAHDIKDRVEGSNNTPEIKGIYDDATDNRLSNLSKENFDVLIIASDEDKEELLMKALPHIKGTPKILVGGYAHHNFKDSIFDEELSKLKVPSLANGYPHTLTHIYNSLVNASRLNLKGSVVELGTYRGGTAMFLARLIKRLGQEWKVITFDNFDGFPPRRSPLDMYNHPGVSDAKLEEVKRYLKDENVEIVAGDIVETAKRLENEPLILSFIDTDNYSPARAALEIIKERTLVGGSIVFDHFTGVDRFAQTLGEKIAGKILLEDDRYFHLHGTGVFFRQR